MKCWYSFVKYMELENFQTFRANEIFEFFRDLFLPREFHCQIAIMIVKTLYLYAEEVPVAGGAALISQGVRQVGNTYIIMPMMVKILQLFDITGIVDSS